MSGNTNIRCEGLGWGGVQAMRAKVEEYVRGTQAYALKGFPSSFLTVLRSLAPF